MRRIIPLVISIIICTLADAIVIQKLEAGKLTPMCRPYSVDTTMYGKLYAVAQVNGTTATLLPVTKVDSGVPFVLLPDSNCIITDSISSDSIAADILALWDATILRGDYNTNSWVAVSVDSTTITHAEDLQYIIADPANLNIMVNIENRCVQRYLSAAHYGYEDSAIVEKFRYAPPQRFDWPQQVIIPMSDGKKLRFMNLTPGEVKTFEVSDSNGITYKGTIKATGTARMIGLETPNHNMRDLGGWSVGHCKRVRHGLLYRSAELNGSYPCTEEEIKYLKDDIGIKAELDLRYDNEHEKHDQAGISAFGFSQADTTYYWACANDYSAESMMQPDTRARLKEEFGFILYNLSKGRPVNFHCHYGVDRTGIMAMLLLGVLGVDIDQIYKDHELSTFGPYSWTSLKEEMKDRVDVITSINAPTLRDKFEEFFTDSLGVAAKDIETFRSIMLYIPDSLVHVPHINITFGNDNAWNSENWIGKDGKSTWIDATISIDGGGRYPDMLPTEIKIKGRGNSSWYQSPYAKNPYNFKFTKKQQPLGLKKGKKWTLLSNKITGSMLTNAIGMKIAELFDCAWVNHMLPVELYCNSSYRGSYNLTEKPGFGSNSVDLKDESLAALIELDTYDTDPTEPIDSSNAARLPVKIDDPDFLEEDNTRLITKEQVINDINHLIQLVHEKDSTYANYIDIERMASFIAACELMGNCELKHPKSVKLYTENVTDNVNDDGVDPTPWVFAPIWDLDYAFGREESDTTKTNKRSYFIHGIETDYLPQVLDSASSANRNYCFFHTLLMSNDKVRRAYYRKWYEFMTQNKLQVLFKYIDEYYDFAAPSLLHNNKNATINRDATNYAAQKEKAKQWLRQRAELIFSRHRKRFTHQGDVNTDGSITMADANMVVNYFLSNNNEEETPSDIDMSVADINVDGQVTMADANIIVNTYLGADKDIDKNESESEENE